MCDTENTAAQPVPDELIDTLRLSLISGVGPLMRCALLDRFGSSPEWLLLMSMARWRLGDFAASYRLADYARVEYRSRGDTDGEMRAQNVAAAGAFARGRLREARAGFERAAYLARQLSDLFRRRRDRRTSRDAVEIAADERANALIVLSSPANFELIKRIIAELDTEESRKTETRSYELEYADADDVAEQLNDLYSALQQTSYYSPWYYSPRRSTATTRFVPERRTNTLIVIAPPSEFEEIEALIEKLDQPIAEAEVSPRVYHIRHIDAKEMTDVLNDIFGVEETRGVGGYGYYYSRQRSRGTGVGRLYGKVRFVHEPSTNSVIVITNNKANFPIIEALIQKLDQTTADYANTMVYELENADATDLANQINILFAVPGAGRPPEKEDPEAEARAAYYDWITGRPSKEEERPISNLIGKVRVVPVPRTNSLLITTAVQNFEVLRQLIMQLDVETPKVLIKIQLVEIMRTQQIRKGMRLGSTASVFDSKDFNSGFLSTFGVAWDKVTKDTVLSADMDVALLIQFLERKFNARVLGQPSLVVNNNKEATLIFGSEIPFIETSTGEPGTIGLRVTYAYREVGTKLVIKPQINPKNKVVTTVQLTASQMREGELLLGGAILDTRSFDTVVAVDDGQTLVIGGILRQEEGEIFHKMPIPVLDLIFRKRDKTLTTTELIAFITPTVLRTRAEADLATEQAREKLSELEIWRPGEGERTETPSE